MLGFDPRRAALLPLLISIACTEDEATSDRPQALDASLPPPLQEPEGTPEPEVAPEPGPRGEPDVEPESGPEPDDDQPSPGAGGRDSDSPDEPGSAGERGDDGGAVGDSGRGGSAGAGEEEPIPPMEDAGSPAPSDASASPLEPEPTPTGTPVAVAVGYGMRRVSSQNGVDWEYFEELTPDGGDDNDLFRGLTFGGGRFVAVGGSSMSVSLVSPDGQTWESEDRAQDAWLGGVAFLNGEFIAAGGNGLRVHSEDLGQSWLDPVGYQAIHYRDAAAGAGVVVAVGHTYNEDPDVGIIAVTSDGREWEEVGRNGDNFSRVAYGNGAFIATGGGGRVSRSADGSSWDDSVVGTGDGSVVFANDEFFVSNGGGVFRSRDGVDWTPVDGASAPIAGYIAGLYLTLDWPARIRASADMIEWDVVFDPGGSGFTRIVTGYVE